MYKKLREAEGEWNEEQKVFNKMKKVVKDESENKKFEQGKRSGVGYINKRYSKANNEYCKDYNNKKKNIVGHILYFNQPEQKGQGLKILI